MARIRSVSHSEACALAERLLDRRERALRAGLEAHAERLLLLAWQAYDLADACDDLPIPEGQAVDTAYQPQRSFPDTSTVMASFGRDTAFSCANAFALGEQVNDNELMQSAAVVCSG